MKAALLILILIVFTALGAQIPVGKWTFDNGNDLLAAEAGNPLVLQGTHSAITGPTGGNGAVRIGAGSFYRCFHNIAANGGGSWVNEYSLMIDFRVPTLGQWYTFLQTGYQNNNDGDAFVNPSGQIGVAQTGYSAYTLNPGEWYRLIISVDLGSSFKYYLDGQLLHDGGFQAMDGRFALYPQSNQNQVLFFADDNGEDSAIDVAEIRIWDVPLSALQALSMGGYGHDISAGPAAMIPFLQSPTPTSMYVSWHYGGEGMVSVLWGTSPSMLHGTALGTTQTLSSSLKWHTVKLEGLPSNTKIYYRCISGDGISPVYSFKTLPTYQQTYGRHLRFILVSDSQTNAAVSTSIVNKIVEKCEELYGENWRDEIDLVIHSGDIVGNGANLSSYVTEFFLPFAPLSHGIPIQVAIGNHEVESANYYNYMNYQDFAGPEGEKYYSFDIVGNRFIFLNSNHQSAQQVQWLTQKVAEITHHDGYVHIFTFVHHPGQSEIWPAGNTAWTQNTVIPILEGSAKASLLVSGHSHNYEHGTSRVSRLRKLITGGAGGTLDRWGMYGNQQDYAGTHKALDQYHWVLVDLDFMYNDYTATVYTLGNVDRPRDNEVVDFWQDRWWANYPIPYTGLLGAVRLPGNRIQLTMKPFDWTFPHVTEEFFSIGGEIASDPVFGNILSQKMRDKENVYGDSGAPAWEPIDLNAGMDTRRIVLDASALTDGGQYWVRGMYRSESLHLINTPGQAYTHAIYSPDCDFTAERMVVLAGEEIAFTDLSGADITAWNWDFDNDGVFDSTLRDPAHTYAVPGTYSVRLGIQTEAGYLECLKDGFITVHPVTNDDLLDSPQQVSVYPNPFRDVLSISAKGIAPHSRAAVYNVKGQKVADLSEASLRDGELLWQWDGKDTRGVACSNGIYLLRVFSSQSVISRKLQLIRR